MKNYDEMSDFDINLAVAKLIYRHPSDCDYYKFYQLSGSDGKTVQVNAYKMWPKDLDYCNNPSDAWPIIVENGISIFKDNQDSDNDWRAMGDVNLYCDWEGNEAIESCSFDSYNKNPLRAAMICFLKMKDAES